MSTSSQSAGTKIVFWVVIGVMVLGSIVSFSAFSFMSPNQQGANVQTAATNTEAKSLEGTVKKMDLGQNNQTAYYLETAGTMVTFLTEGNSKIKLEDYVDKDVKVQGVANGADTTNSAPILSVTKIDLAN